MQISHKIRTATITYEAAHSVFKQSVSLKMSSLSLLASFYGHFVTLRQNGMFCHKCHKNKKKTTELFNQQGSGLTGAPASGAITSLQIKTVFFTEIVGCGLK